MGGLADIDLLVALFQFDGGIAGGVLVVKNTKHRRAAAGHLGRDGPMRPQRFTDGGRFHRAGAVFQRIARRRTDASQVVGADGLFLGLAVGVDRAAHRVIPGKGLGRRDADAGHRHDEPAVRAGRQGFHQIAHAAHAAGTAQQRKRHIRADARADGAQFAHGKPGVVQFVQTNQHARSVSTAARHAGTHRHPLVNRHLHARQQAGVVEKRQRRLDGGVFIVGGHKAAGQGQRQVIAAAQRDFFVQVDGLHDHVQIVVAVGQRAHNVQRQVQLGRGQHRYRAVLHCWSLSCCFISISSRVPLKIHGCASWQSANGLRCTHS